MINRRYHFYFIFLSAVIPMLTYTLLFGFAVPVWIFSKNTFPTSLEIVLNVVNATRFGTNIIFFVAGVWIASILASPFYIWNLVALYLSKQPKIRRKIKIFSYTPFMIWQETYKNLRELN